MIQLKIIIALLLSILLCYSCKRYDTRDLISYKDFWGYVNYPTSARNDFKPKSILIKDLYFNFDKGVPVDLSTIDHEFLIKIGGGISEGVIYRGPFDKHIEVKNISLCADNHISSCYMVAFILIDYTNKRLFKWHKKEAYYLYKQDEYYISLKLNGEYDLR